MPAVILGAPGPIFADPSQGTPGAPSPTAGVMTVQGITGMYPVGVIAGITGPVSVNNFPPLQAVTGPILIQGVATGGVQHAVVTDGVGRLIISNQLIKRVLAQSVLVPNILNDVYSCATINAEISNIFICNRSPGNATVSLSVAVADAADDPKQYLFHNIVLKPGASLNVDDEITLANSDVLRVQVDVDSVNVNVFGSESMI